MCHNTKQKTGVTAVQLDEMLFCLLEAAMPLTMQMSTFVYSVLAVVIKMSLVRKLSRLPARNAELCSEPSLFRTSQSRGSGDFYSNIAVLRA